MSQNDTGMTTNYGITQRCQKQSHALAGKSNRQSADCVEPI